MKIICKKDTNDSGEKLFLTLEKAYHTFSADWLFQVDSIVKVEYYLLKNDEGKEIYYSSNLFYTQKEVRKKKLDKLNYK